MSEQPDDAVFADDGGIKPLKIGEGSVAAVPMIDLFELNGTMYQCPERPSGAMILRFMREARNPKVGRDGALVNLMSNLLGEDALNAMSESTKVSDQDIADVFAIIGRIAYIGIGRFNELAGN